eukprot:COSAG03_NODE_8472_length_799_cov_2.310000_2_plen_88_part_01
MMQCVRDPIIAVLRIYHIWHVRMHGGRLLASSRNLIYHNGIHYVGDLGGPRRPRDHLACREGATPRRGGGARLAMRHEGLTGSYIYRI